jgi:hypothetical protein
VYMAGFSLAWSIVSLLTYKASTYEHMLVCRFILGIVEAPVRHTEEHYHAPDTMVADLPDNSSILVPCT